MFNVSVRDMKLTPSETHRHNNSSKVKAEDDVETLVAEFIKQRREKEANDSVS